MLTSPTSLLASRGLFALAHNTRLWRRHPRKESVVVFNDSMLQLIGLTCVRIPASDFCCYYCSRSPGHALLPCILLTLAPLSSTNQDRSSVRTTDDLPGWLVHRRQRNNFQRQALSQLHHLSWQHHRSMHAPQRHRLFHGRLHVVSCRHFPVSLISPLDLIITT